MKRPHDPYIPYWPRDRYNPCCVWLFRSWVRLATTKRVLKLLTVGLIGLALPGCGTHGQFCTGLREYVHNHFKVGPNYCRPGAAAADQWIDADDPRVVSEEADYSTWWMVFGDPVLDNLVVTAYEQNLPLRVAALRVLQARAERGIAVGNLFPQFQQAVARYSRQERSLSSFPKFPPSGPNPKRFEDWSAGFDAAWELDLWGRFRRNIEAADANLQATVEDYDDLLVTLIGEVGAAYIEIRTFDERIELARRNIEIQTGSLNIAEVRFTNGAVTKLDVDQGRTNLADTQRLVPLFEKGRRRAQNRLCTLLGIPPRDIDDLLGGRGRIPKTPTQAAIGIPADLLRRRPDVRAAERRVAEQSARIGVAESDLYPRLIVTGTIGVQASSATQLFEDASQIGAIGPALRWNILNYGRIINNVAVQQARFQQLAVTYQNTVLAANQEAEDALVGFLRTQEEAARLREGVAAADSAVRTAQAQYSEGATDFNRVFTLQTVLVAAQDDLAATTGEIAVNLVRLYKALGGGWELRYGNTGGELVPPAAAAAVEQDDLLPPVPEAPVNQQQG